MNELLQYLKETPGVWKKLMAVLLSLLVILAFFPKEAKFQYEFQKGMPWLHKDLIAPFDFAIYKTEEQLENESRDLKEKNIPYFSFNESVQKQRIAAFEAEFQMIWDSLESTEHEGFPELSITQDLQLGSKILETIYSKGLLETHESLLDKNESEGIYLLKKELATYTELRDVFTISEALEYINNELSGRPSQTNERLSDLIKNHLAPNLIYDKQISEKRLNEQLNNISLSFGKISKNQKIIGKGEIVNEELFQVLSSLKKEYELRSRGSGRSWILLSGQILIAAISLLSLLLFLSIFHKHIIQENRRLYFVLLIFTLSFVMGAMPRFFDDLSIYILPFCILPIVIRSFFETRLALFIHLLAMILIGFVAPNGFEFVFVQSIAGLMALFSLVGLRKRSQLLTTAAVIFFSYSVTFIGLSIMHEASLDRVHWANLQWFALSAVLTLLVYPLIYLFEKAFGLLSDVTLMEISDTNAPVLRELNTKAPGTFQHSLQVANLAEAGILRIGGDPLLVRTGALYHDIGKMRNPAFFIENQTPGMNPHDALSNEQSAEIIIAHVEEGVKIAKKHQLPERIIDFIRTHHGTSLVRYFYTQQMNDAKIKSVEKINFQYKGPLPFSKETAVLMMADAVEAASRSLKSYTEESISQLVHTIIDYQVNEQQFEQADITFKDVSTLKDIFIRMLKTIYHVRIEYPQQNQG